MSKLEAAILKTLAYADIFDFPLKKDEIWRFLIINQKPKTSAKGRSSSGRKNQKHTSKTQKLIRQGKLGKRSGFYFLKGREKIVKLREKREEWSKEKLKIAKRVVSVLKIIPTVKMVAVTGALAMKNSEKEDDIDFLIVGQKEKLWITRFLTTILVEIFARRRRPGDKNITNKICLNMFLDEEHFAVLRNKRDLFSAHEVVQLKSLWDKDKTYQKFLAANQWVKIFLPNTIIKTKNKKQKTKNTYKKANKFILNLLSVICYLLSVENVLKHFQLWYMRNRRTTETISAGIICFHPQDARVWILKEYQKRIDSLKK